MTELLVPLSAHLKDSILCEKQQENLQFQFLNSKIHGIEERLAADLMRFPRINKEKAEYFQDRSVINLRNLVKNIFQLFPSPCEQIVDVLALLLDAGRYAKFGEAVMSDKEKAFNLFYVYKLFAGLFSSVKIVDKVQQAIKLRAQLKINYLTEGQQLDPWTANLIKIAAFP